MSRRDEHPVLLAALGWSGRMVSASKTHYCRAHPDHILVFNAGVCVERGGLPELLGEGDLDLTLSISDLIIAAKAIGEALFVLDEADRPDVFRGARGEVLARAVAQIDPDGEVSFRDEHVVVEQERRPRLDLVGIENRVLAEKVRGLQGRCERLDTIVKRGVEQGWVTKDEREAALWFPRVSPAPGPTDDGGHES